jgi:hypothetical protein
MLQICSNIGSLNLFGVLEPGTGLRGPGTPASENLWIVVTTLGLAGLTEAGRQEGVVLC